MVVESGAGEGWLELERGSLLDLRRWVEVERRGDGDGDGDGDAIFQKASGRVERALLERRKSCHCFMN